MDDAEDRRGPSDAQCERQDDRRREPWIASKAASGETDITHRFSKDLPAAIVSDGFSGDIGRSHTEVGLTPRRYSRLNRMLLLIKLACEVIAQLLIEFGGHA
jgi:hypothetical protein